MASTIQFFSIIKDIFVIRFSTLKFSFFAKFLWGMFLSMFYKIKTYCSFSLFHFEKWQSGSDEFFNIFNFTKDTIHSFAIVFSFIYFHIENFLESHEAFAIPHIDGKSHIIARLFPNYL